MKNNSFGEQNRDRKGSAGAVDVHQIRFLPNQNTKKIYIIWEVTEKGHDGQQVSEDFNKILVGHAVIEILNSRNPGIIHKLTYSI
jgi:hypothetical protein